MREPVGPGNKAPAPAFSAGCGDVLEGVGDLSRDLVHGDTTSTLGTTTLLYQLSSSVIQAEKIKGKQSGIQKMSAVLAEYPAFIPIFLKRTYSQQILVWGRPTGAKARNGGYGKS